MRPDAVLGHSSDARTFLALRGNPLRAAARRVAGGSFLLHNLYARSLPCDALLAPARLGDVAVLHLVSERQSTCSRDDQEIRNYHSGVLALRSRIVFLLFTHCRSSLDHTVAVPLVASVPHFRTGHETMRCKQRASWHAHKA